jgi:NDP-sugar pyrophosphorylase family protein
MRPLTDNTPKPLVRVAGKPLLYHVVQAVPEEITELIIVEGYLGDQIKKYCGDEFMGRSVTYVHQPEKLGTADALLRCREVINSRFLLLYADDLFGGEGLARLLTHDNALLVMEHDQPERFGVVTINQNGEIIEMHEKPEDPPSNLVSVGPMVLSKDIFDYQPDIHKSGELTVPSMVQKMAQDKPIHVEHASFWFPVANPDHVQEAEEILKKRNH